MSEEGVTTLLRARAARRMPADLNELVGLLPSGASQQLRVAIPLLRNIVTFETREMLVTSVASQPGATTRVQVDAIISRNADGHVTWRRVAR